MTASLDTNFFLKRGLWTVCAMGAVVSLASCKSSPRISGLPSKLPNIPVSSSPATPGHSMPRSEYPFDAQGNYVSEWAATSSGASSAASSYSTWKSSHTSSSSGSSSGSTKKTPASSPPKKTSTSSTPKKATSTASSGTSHTVKSGDTLYGLARSYGSSVAKIKSANGLSSDLIRPGQKLKIPR